MLLLLRCWLSGFYLLFLVAADLSYSVGRWVQLRGPWFEPPTTLRTTGTDLIWTATNNFEEDWNTGGLRSWVEQGGWWGHGLQRLAVASGGITCRCLRPCCSCNRHPCMRFCLV